MNTKKLAGVLPKNQLSEAVPYKEPPRPKRVEVERADDGTYSMRMHGGPNGDKIPYSGKLMTAANWDEVSAKGKAHMEGEGKSEPGDSKKEEKGEKK